MIFDKINLEKRAFTDIWKGGYSVQGTGDNSEALKEATYYRCLDYLGNALAKMPIAIMQDTPKGIRVAKEHRWYKSLHYKFNTEMTAFDSMKAFVQLGYHKGYSALYIDRNNCSLIPCDIISILIDDSKLYKNVPNATIYTVKINNKIFDVPRRNLIVFRAGLSLDGINTMSISDNLSETIDVLNKGESYVTDLYRRGLTNKIVVQCTSSIEEKGKLKAVQNKFAELYDTEATVFPIPAGFSATPLNMDLGSSQFVELKNASSKALASAFGLPLAVINGESNTSGNLYALQTGILTDTLAPKVEQLKQEFTTQLLGEQEIKQGYFVDFDTRKYLSIDPQTEAEIITKYTSGGLYSVNEGRYKIGMPLLDIPEANEPLITSGFLTLSTMTEYYGNGGKGNDNTKDTDTKEEEVSKDGDKSDR